MISIITIIINYYYSYLTSCMTGIGVQMPRSYHNGIKGTFMNLETHNKYFRDIGYNTNTSIHWPPPATTTPGILSLQQPQQGRDMGNTLGYLKGHYKVDTFRIEQLVKSCKHINSVKDLLSYTGNLMQQ